MIDSEKNGSITWDYCGMFWPFTSVDSFSDHLREMFLPMPSTHQGWFLCYLFFYSQLMASLFIAVHPNHQVKIPNNIGVYQNDEILFLRTRTISVSNDPSVKSSRPCPVLTSSDI